MFECVRSAVEIQCQDPSCPNCNTPFEQEFKVEQIDAQGREFSFRASVHCIQCDTRKNLAEVIEDPLKLKRLEVKLSGIVTER